ncbi:hypothetical protein [Ensifer adhaerens]
MIQPMPKGMRPLLNTAKPSSTPATMPWPRLITTAAVSMDPGAGEFSNDRKEAMQAGLDQVVAKAAQLAVEGSSYVREVAEHDADLQRAIGQAETNIGRSMEAPPSTADVTVEQECGLHGVAEDRSPLDNDAREAHDLAATVEATNRLQDRTLPRRSGPITERRSCRLR